MFQRVIICIGIASRTKGCPFAGTYRLSWTSRVPKRGKLGLEILGDVKPVGEESADEKLEIIPVADVLVRDIVLENAVNSWSARCLHFASKLQSMKPKSNALSLVPPAREFPVVVVVVVVKDGSKAETRRGDDRPTAASGRPKRQCRHDQGN